MKSKLEIEIKDADFDSWYEGTCTICGSENTVTWEEDSSDSEETQYRGQCSECGEKYTAYFVKTLRSITKDTLYEVRKVTSFIGENGYGYMADLYKNGDRIGIAIDIGVNGDLHFELLPNEEITLMQYSDKSHYKSVDEFVNSLVNDFMNKRGEQNA